MKKITIITEGNVEMGLGHVQRMLTLSREISQFSHVTFLTQSGSRVMKRINDYGFNVIQAPSSYEIALAQMGETDCVLIDRLEVAESLAFWVKNETKAKIVIFGNISSANRHADIVINAIIGTHGFQNGRRTDLKTGTLFMEGPRYVMLGEDFRAHRNTYQPKGTLKSILLMFGGSDQANLTCRVANKLMEHDEGLHITACVGSLYPFMDELGEIQTKSISSCIQPIEVLINAENICILMQKVDCVITSPGNCLFEAMCIGVPVVSFFQTEKQAVMFRDFPTTHEQSDVELVYELAARVVSNYTSYKREIDSMDVAEGWEEMLDAILE